MAASKPVDELYWFKRICSWTEVENVATPTWMLLGPIVYCLAKSRTKSNCFLKFVLVILPDASRRKRISAGFDPHSKKNIQKVRKSKTITHVALELPFQLQLIEID